jgi:hypothetical protein
MEKEWELKRADLETKLRAMKEIEASKATMETKVSKALNRQTTAVFDNPLDDIDPYRRSRNPYALQLEKWERRKRRIPYEVPWRL